ncbi:hypothetical protein EG329_010950 [Mollisiaceae sp. DMI_Dod_QoI]|nr:hypothetical protein EG329_010950 [Helotiales sp. DMI_Dod_QoI]
MPALIHVDQGVTPVFKMWAHLLKYAISFERCAQFKKDMGGALLDDESEVDQHVVNKAIPVQNDARRYENPFKDSHNSHPVEQGLYQASKAASDHDISKFKYHRAIVLHYLETQYLDILIERNIIKQFLEGEFRVGGFSGTCDAGDLPLAMAHLGTYARAFQRHLDLPTRARMIKHRRNLKQLYDDLPRELAIKRLYDMIELETSKNLEEFGSLFRLACGDIDRQFFEILSARKKLFSCDVGKDRSCGIDPDLGSGHTTIQWIQWDTAGCGEEWDSSQASEESDSTDDNGEA